MTGAAVAVAVEDHLECIRSIGRNAPPVGSRCDPGVGLTGSSFLSGKIQLCNDTENDSRAERDACADLNVRSVLVVPTKTGAAITGVLEVLSPEANAFDWRAIKAITRIARNMQAVHVSPPLRGGDQNQAASRPVRGVGCSVDLQELLHAVWVVQQSGASATKARQLLSASKQQSDTME